MSSSRIRVKASSWSVRGEAIAQADGLVPLHVWQGIPGEVATVRVEREGKHQARARYLSSEEPSPLRRGPRCEKYDRCGGCALMHLKPEGQQAVRRELVTAAFESAGIPMTIEAYHESPDGEEGFRHVVKVGVEETQHGRLRMGAYGRGTRECVPIPNCNVATPLLRKTMATLAHFAIELKVKPWIPATDEGVFRSAVIRQSRMDGSLLLTLIGGGGLHNFTDLAARIAEEAPEIVGVFAHRNSKPGNAIFDRGLDGTAKLKFMGGRDYIEEKLGDVVYRIGPGDFFQTNPSVAEVLYERTLERLALGKGDSLLDLYCGVGGLALQAAHRGAFAFGVEENRGAIDRAKETSRRNRLAAEFLSGQVVEELPDLRPRFAGTGMKIVVNPARRGLEEGVVDEIVKFEPGQVAYISCNPTALANDVSKFLEHGWSLQPLELFDMFPQTPHVEVLAVLNPPAGQAPKRRAPRRKVVR